MKDASKPLLGADSQNAPSLRAKLFEMVEGNSQVGKAFLTVSFGITFCSFGIFALNTEPMGSSWRPSDHTKETTFEQFEMLTIAWFTVEFVLRFWTSVELHPDVESLPAGAHMASRVCWAFTNIFAVVDLVAILPWYAHHLFGTVYYNLQWLRVIRILRALPDLPWGEIMTKSSPLLFAGGFAGFTVWIICASLYYMFESENPMMMYSPVGDDYGPNDPQWNLFHSIPASMYFTLCNFFGEFPLIDQHSTGGRFVGMFIQVAGAAVMAIPAGAIGNAFADVIDDVEGGDDDDDEDGDDGDAPAAEGETAVAVPAAESNKTKWERCLDGESGVMDMPYTDAIGGVDAGDFLRVGVCLMSLCSVAHFVLSSLTTFPGNLETTEMYLQATSFLATIWLTLEYLYRLKLAAGGAGLFSYAFSVLGFIDLFGVLPLMCYVHPASSWWRATKSLRILKLERFVGAFTLFWKIMCKSSAAFLATGTMAMVCWLLFSTIMYFLESENADADISRYYSSVFTSMWMTLLNLTGEVPICQYTPWGKVVSGIMGLFGVGFVSIPMGLLGGAFQDDLEDEDEAPEFVTCNAGDVAGDEAVEAATGGDLMGDEGLTKRQKVFKFLQGSGDNQLEDMNPWEGRAVRFEQFVIFVIFVSAVVATLEANGPADAGTSDTWQQSAFEAFVTLLFTFEYCLRYFSAPENPYWKEQGYIGDAACRFANVTSWSSVIDLCAIAPFYFSLAGSSLADKYDGQLRMLRVFRLLTLDKYIPSVSLISRVVKNKSAQFKMAGYAMGALWVIFATLLWLTERNDKFKINDLRQDQRYHTVISALPFTLVHLTGDYPLVDYTLHARICLFFALIFAVGVVAVPAGLLANGFQSELAAYNQEQRSAQSAARSKIEKVIKAWVIRRRFMKVINAAVAQDKEEKRKERLAAKANDAQWKMHLFLDGLTPAGKAWSKFMMLLIVLNVAAVLLETVIPVKDFMGQQFWDTFELVSVMIFTVMYMAHIWVAPVDGSCGYNRSNYIWSFWGIVDFITVAPYWCQMGMVTFDVFPALAKHAFIFRVVRVLRILQMEDYVESFTLLDDAWFEARDSMIACGFLALMVWVCGSVLFYNFEQGNERMGGAFDTLSSSMYYTLIFLGGEWGLVDFTPAGQVVCVFYCVAGIGLYGIPVGAVFTAFGSVLEERAAVKAAQDAKEEQQAAIEAAKVAAAE